MSRDHDWQVGSVVKRKDQQTGQNFLDSIINGLRIGIGDGKILVDKEKCPNLYSQLKYGIWNERRTDFERSKEMGHWDAGMSLCYMFDNINWGKNPYPILPADVTLATHFIDPSVYDRDKGAAKKLGKIFGKKTRR